MAWRVEEYVIRGEIDNRVRGRVTGKIWFSGRFDPVALDLRGDAHRDIAGKVLRFINPNPAGELPESFASLQSGVLGDCTASRKTRVPDLPASELMRRYARKESFPWHWGNALYIEWFGTANGRVILESPAFELAIDPEGAWEMTAEEEIHQRVRNAAAVQDFMARERVRASLADIRENRRAASRHHRPAEPAPVLPPAGSSQGVATFRACEHPLYRQVADFASRLRREAKANGWFVDPLNDEHPMVEMTWKPQLACAKLAAGLNACPWPPDALGSASVLVRLERARDYLREAIAGAEQCLDQDLAARDWVKAATAALHEFEAETENLIAELRGPGAGN